MKKIFFIILILFFIVENVNLFAKHTTIIEWPKVIPIKRNIRFIDQKNMENHKRMMRKIEIMGENGRPLYLLECRLNAYDSNTFGYSRNEYLYSAEFECRLTSLCDRNNMQGTLLTEEVPQSSYWKNRGRFLTNEIKGKYADVPEYGKLRHFKLRGMSITLEVKKIRMNTKNRFNNFPWCVKRIQELELEVTVVPDATAISEIAVSPKCVLPFKWPEVNPVNKVIHFVDSNKRIFNFKITGKDKTPLFLLECHLNPTNKENNENSDFYFSGDFHCRLTSLYSKDEKKDLFSEDETQTNEWDNRGRFLLEEITGKCADYPDYGKKRSFGLRGMRLTLEIKHIKLEKVSKDEAPYRDGDKIKELELEVTVASDPLATSETVEQTKYFEPLFPDPKNVNHLIRNCDKILTR